MNPDKNNYILKEDIKDMRNISLILLGYDIFIHLSSTSIENEIKRYIEYHSKLIQNLTNGILSFGYEHYISSINLIFLELYHVALKMKYNICRMEDIDCVNMDILKIQHYFLRSFTNISLILYYDISDDFSYYLKSSKLQDKNSIDSNSSNTSTNSSEKSNDNKLTLFEIINGISNDENFFNINHYFLSDKNVDKNTIYDNLKTSYDIYKILFLPNKEIKDQRNFEDFIIITTGLRIYINLSLINYILKYPEKIKYYPIAKPIAIACKSADDCTICVKLLLETLENDNNIPIRFCFTKAKIYYQCCIIYILRYIATQKQKFKGRFDNSFFCQSVFSSFPQETLAPCYFYLKLLKEMSEYFINAKKYIKEIKLLIYKANLTIQDHTFNINIINDIFL